MSLPRRVLLTYRVHGPRVILSRIATYPLRFTPLRARIDPRRTPSRHGDRMAAMRWYARRGRPVTIVIPSHRDFEHVRTAVSSIRRTTNPKMVEIVVCDDASGPDHLARLRTLDAVRVIAGERNLGFAGNVNRGLRAADPRHDVVLLNSDVIAGENWLACLQYATGWDRGVGIVGAKLLYPNGRIQSAGTIRNTREPVWFDHRYRMQPSDWGPANIPTQVLAVCGACMYIRREVLDAIGGFDEGYPMAYEDVDLCLRAWQAGHQVVYWPDAELTHLESVTRGTVVGERELQSQRRFWQKWGRFLDGRNVRTADGRLRVIYVTEDTGVGGGHRDVFEHLNRLAQRGHEAELWTLADPPDWFEISVPVRSFPHYAALASELSKVDAIKVATWWNTAHAVWRASILRGVPVYFVQDIETSYYEHDRRLQHAVLSWYREEFAYMTISPWNRDRLRELGLDAELIPPGIDLDTFRPLPGVQRRDDMILALGRSNPLKNLPLTLAAWRALPEPRPELVLFGIEPELTAGEPGITYITAPTDQQVAELFNQATVFVQTSTHEGFCLPPLESMATGGAVVCTDAHGNREFCINGINCLIPTPNQKAVTAAIKRLLDDPALRHRLGQAATQTATDYSWPKRIDALETFLNRVASPPGAATHEPSPATGAAPAAGSGRPPDGSR